MKFHSQMQKGLFLPVQGSDALMSTLNVSAANLFRSLFIFPEHSSSVAVGNAANTARYPATLAALPTGTEEDSSRKTNKLGNKLAAETFNVDISASEPSTGKNRPFCICE